MNGPNEGGPPVHQEIIGRDPEKRVRTLTRKALENAVEEKRREVDVGHKMLRETMQSIEELNEGSDFVTALRHLEGVSAEFKIKIEELQNLYSQDRNSYLGSEELLLTSESLTLDQARKLVEEIKSRKSDKLLETRSRQSRLSYRSKTSSRTSTASSTAKMKALAEAAAAREGAEFEKRIAEKEHEHRKREAEIERTREQERANHEREMAILAAERKVAIADAKLKAIKQAIEEEEIGDKSEIACIPYAKTQERTLTWVNSTSPEAPQPGTDLAKQETPLRAPEMPPAKSRATADQLENNGEDNQNTHHAFSQSFIALTPINITRSQLIEALTSVNEQIVPGLARQNLPKCHPDTFGGDPTLFHPWKAAFRAMVSDSNVSPVQEVNYLHRFTSGEVQKLVDSYRKRKQYDPGRLLSSLWAELERRFRSAAAITRVLLECMNKTAAFNDGENAKLQGFADLCADVESQISYLPGLACLNFPNAIQPIAEKLPHLCAKNGRKKSPNTRRKTAETILGFTSFLKSFRTKQGSKTIRTSCNQ